VKTNPFARSFLKIRVMLFCLAVVGIAVFGFRLGRLVTTRLGQTTAPQTESLHTPNGSLADAMAAARY
jgi:hypothetical protein